MQTDIKKPSACPPPVFPRFRRLPLRHAAQLVMAGLICTARAGEVGAYPYMISWPDGGINLGTYSKAASTVVQSAGGNGWKSYASANFHALAAAGSAASAGTGSFGKPEVGGGSYWFEQMTISSPSVPTGTTGTADFTLFFTGQLSAGPSISYQSGSYRANINYRWSGGGDGADNVADPNVGESYTQTVTVFSGYAETTGTSFLNQPRHHQMTFRFGVPFDFTVSVSCRGNVWKNSPSKASAAVRCAGWNGFRNVQVRFGDPVTDATITSQSGFNYADPGSTTYAQWASLYQLDASSKQADSNGNGLSNLMEYALGRNPSDPDSSPPVTPGVVDVSGNAYQTFTFTRPKFGARPVGITYFPQRSGTLGGWSDSGLEMTTAPSDTQSETVTVRSAQPISGQSQEFLRLKVTEP